MTIHYEQKETRITTSGGPVTVRSFLRPEEIAGLSMESFTRHPQYNPIVSKKESLVKAAELPDANVTLAINGEREIVGLGILEYAPGDSRWIRVGDRIMMEVAVIQISGPYRSGGVANTLLDLLVHHPFREDRILYMCGYSWTWDLSGSGRTAMEYRDVLIHLFSRQGFRILQTNDTNIMLRPENLFMARIGRNIPDYLQKQFKMVRFNLDL